MRLPALASAISGIALAVAGVTIYLLDAASQPTWSIGWATYSSLPAVITAPLAVVTPLSLLGAICVALGLALLAFALGYQTAARRARRQTAGREQR